MLDRDENIGSSLSLVLLWLHVTSEQMESANDLSKDFDNVIIDTEPVTAESTEEQLLATFSWPQ